MYILNKNKFNLLLNINIKIKFFTNIYLFQFILIKKELDLNEDAKRPIPRFSHFLVMSHYIIMQLDKRSVKVL